MAFKLKIKEEFKGEVVAFSNSGTPLGERSKEELIDLAIQAQSSNDPTLKKYFEGALPDLADLRNAKMGTIEKIAESAPEQANNTGENSADENA